MDKNGDSADRGKENSTVPEVYRIRRDQVVSTVALPILITIVGLSIGFVRNLYTDADSRIRSLRDEFRAGIKDQRDILSREIERSEERQREEIRRLERWLINIQDQSKERAAP